MAVRIRLARLGRKNRPFYRVVATDGRSPRDGRNLEILGHYDPISPDDAKKCRLDEERVKYWLGVGAQPSVVVRNLIRAAGIRPSRPGKKGQPVSK